ncbi:MAG TPA: hypothetical protein VF322_09755 [Gammaproteobacteria bacterium]
MGNSRAKRALIEGGKYLSVDFVILLGTVLVSVAGTFLATKAALEDRIDELEDRLPVSDYLTSRTLFQTINQLSYLRNELDKLEKQLAQLNIPKKLEYVKGVPPELGNYPATPWQLSQEWLARPPDDTTIESLNVTTLSVLLQSDAAMTLGSNDAYVRLQRLIQLAHSFNQALGEVVYVFGLPTPQAGYMSISLRRGASRETTERFLRAAAELIPEMKATIVGLPDTISDEIQTTRSILERLKAT